jgi:hypothetical protein
VARKSFGINGGRSNDQLEIRSPRQQLLEVAEQEINVKAALMRLVDNDCVVLAQQRIGLGFCQQDTVRHEFDPGAARQGVVEADLETDNFARRRIQFLRDPLCGRRSSDASWLGVPDQTFFAAAEFEANFRQLRCFARTGFAADDNHLVFYQQRGNVFPATGNRQFLRIRDWWQRIA